jgi:hypothetical protein
VLGDGRAALAAPAYADDMIMFVNHGFDPEAFTYLGARFDRRVQQDLVVDLGDRHGDWALLSDRWRYVEE